MTKTVTSNYSGVASPGNSFFQRISADGDGFTRNDIDALGNALELHDHTTGKGAQISSTTSIFSIGTSGSSGLRFNLAATDTDYIAANFQPTLSTANTTQYGVYSTPTFSPTGTVAANAIYAKAITVNAVYSVTNVRGLYVDNPTKGASSTMTNCTGIEIVAQSRGSSNNYGLFINTPFNSGGDNGNVIYGDTAVGLVANAALATNATVGFLYIPSCAGAPTGDPGRRGQGQIGTGRAALVWDSTNNKLWVNTGASTWKGVVLA